ncbi:MAG: ZIP family metal transporter [Bradyrhizobiaceae bacterium]|nr:MAG: ZIP family metal transporter [Bradyrhizobiaceae bacterium]
MSPVTLGFLASLAAGLVTAVGALPVLVGKEVSRRTSDTMLGFAAGVMLAASFFSLIIPGLASAQSIFAQQGLAALVVTTGVLLGAGFVGLLNEVIPHEHFEQGKEGPDVEQVGRVWLFVLAITIHNLPEGLAVGVGFGAGNIVDGAVLATGIGLQNAPEGLAVALALLSIGHGRAKAFAVAALTGLVEPVTGLIGAWAVSLSQQLMPWAMGFAAGAMIYVISHEIIPETHRRGSQTSASVGLMAGLALMMLLDTAL